ncbi:MAG: Rpn family recombination-promoting nuclease/putative transposase [Caldilineaceae bacterium]
MANELINPHDAFFKQYLSHPQVATDFLRHHLPAAVAQQVDLNHLHLVKDSFIDERLRSHFSDLIYRTQTKDQTPLTLALLFEHKSYPDEWVDFQMLRYQVQFWQQELDAIIAERAKAENPRDLPKRRQTPVLVLLVYHGQDEWKISLRFARHLAGLSDPDSELSKALAPYIPDFQPHFVNLTAMSDEEIRGELTTRLFLLVLKHIFEQGMGGRLPEILAMVVDVVNQPSGMEMVVALLRYLSRAGVKLRKEEVVEKLVELLPKEGGILMQTMADEWIEEGKTIGLEEGEKKGRKEGRQEGRIEVRRETILQVLQVRFPPNPQLAATLPDPSNEELLQQITGDLAQIDDEAMLNQLVNRALTVVVLPDFATSVQALVPQKERSAA